MSFIQSQVTGGGIVMAVDRYGVHTVHHVTGNTSVSRKISDGHIYQKLYITKNNIGISCCGVVLNNFERIMSDFLYEMDENLTPYQVATDLLNYLKWINPTKLDTIFHVCGYDMTNPKLPNPCLYLLLAICNHLEKINCDDPYKGAIINTPDPVIKNILDHVAAYYQDYTLRDAVEFAKFIHRTTKDLMMFQGSNEAMSREMDIAIIKPDGCKLMEA